MNRNLFVFSLLLALLGVGLGFYFISFIGLILMIPALLSPSRPPPRSVPMQSQPQQAPRRISPPPFPQRQPTASQAQAKTEASISAPPPAPSYQPMASPSPMASSVASYSPPLFPSPIVPTLNSTGVTIQQGKEPVAQKPGEKDELVEIGTILALLKLALG